MKNRQEIRDRIAYLDTVIYKSICLVPLSANNPGHELSQEDAMNIHEAHLERDALLKELLAK